MSLQELPNEELLDQLLNMTKYFHYSPLAEDRPSEFELDDLEDEVRRRLDLNTKSPLGEDDED